MVSCQQCYPFSRPVIGAVFNLAVLALPIAGEQLGPRFYTDDPLLKEPAPRSVKQVEKRQVDDLYEFVYNSFVVPRRQGKLAQSGPHPALNTNTLGNVPDSPWYTGRHFYRRMSIEELKRGPGNSTPPSSDGRWRVISAKSDGVTPGFVIEDQNKNRYVLKFDPPENPELASAADVIGSKVFYALGYNVPENYIVHFRREVLDIGEGVVFRDATGRKRIFTRRILEQLLKPQPKGPNDTYRALASRFIAGKLAGPFNYQGTRSDDPNDIIPHEDRRELRGLGVFAAWLNHHDTRSINTMDSLVEENGIPYVKHYLLDFGSILGSNGVGPKHAWSGNEYAIERSKSTLMGLATFGFYLPRWERADYPTLKGVGRFDSRSFDPANWKPNYPNQAFVMMDDNDAFWAAEQVASFSEFDIRALVETGEYSDPRATDWIARCLIERRNKIVDAYFSKTVPLDRFRMNGDRLQADDLIAQYGFGSARDYAVQWFAFDNKSGNMTPLAGQTTLALPLQGRDGTQDYFAARFQRDDCPHAVTVYVRNVSGRVEVVGVDRTSLVNDNVAGRHGPQVNASMAMHGVTSDTTASRQ